MRTIYKYPLNFEEEQVISVPFLECGLYTFMKIHEQILKLDVQNRKPCLWIMVDNEKPKRDVKVIFCGTGCKCYEAHEDYVDSFQIEHFLFHVFVRE